MLMNYRASAAAFAAVMTLSANAAIAEQYQVLMLENGFFPEVSYVQPGDQITFVNLSGMSRAVTAADDSWTTPEFDDGGEAAIQIVQDMHITFSTPVNGANSEAEGEQALVTGSLSFSPPQAPLQD